MFVKSYTFLQLHVINTTFDETARKKLMKDLCVLRKEKKSSGIVVCIINDYKEEYKRDDETLTIGKADRM